MAEYKGAVDIVRKTFRWVESRSLTQRDTIKLNSKWLLCSTWANSGCLLTLLISCLLLSLCWPRPRKNCLALSVISDVLPSVARQGKGSLYCFSHLDIRIWPQGLKVLTSLLPPYPLLPPPRGESRENILKILSSFLEFPKNAVALGKSRSENSGRMFGSSGKHGLHQNVFIQPTPLQRRELLVLRVSIRQGTLFQIQQVFLS